MLANVPRWWHLSNPPESSVRPAASVGERVLFTCTALLTAVHGIVADLRTYRDQRAALCERLRLYCFDVVDVDQWCLVLCSLRAVGAALATRLAPGHPGRNRLKYACVPTRCICALGCSHGVLAYVFVLAA